MIALRVDSPPKVATSLVLPSAWSEKSVYEQLADVFNFHTLSFPATLPLHVERVCVSLSIDGAHADVLTE